MSTTFNKVILSGRLAHDPELHFTSKGMPVTSLVMYTDFFPGKGRPKRSSRHRVVFWGKRAEVICEHLTKGRMLYVEGRLDTRSWEDPEGNTRYITEVVADQFKFVGPPPRQEENNG